MSTRTSFYRQDFATRIVGKKEMAEACQGEMVCVLVFSGVAYERRRIDSIDLSEWTNDSSVHAKFRRVVIAAIAVGLAVRVGTVLVHPDFQPSGDPSEYFGQSNLIAAGKGWLEPYNLTFHDLKVQTANLPPLYTLVQVAASLLGFHSYFAHRIWSGIVNAMAIPVVGLVGRQVWGERTGMIAASAMAVYPNVWMSAPTGWSETVTPLTTALVLWSVFRFWKTPSFSIAMVVGLSIGLAILGRDDASVLVVILLVPSVWITAVSVSRRLKLLTVALLGIALVVLPIIVFNSVRFDRPVFVSDEFGEALSEGNCSTTYSGQFSAYWWPDCQIAPTPGVNEVSLHSTDEHLGLTYIENHLGHLPLLEIERVGRTFNIYRPFQQIHLDTYVEHRPGPPAWIGLGMYYLIMVLAVPGGYWLFKQRRYALLPLVACLIDAIMVSVVIYGDTRFRVVAEPTLVLLASIAATLLFERRAVGPRTGARSVDPYP